MLKHRLLLVVGLASVAVLSGVLGHNDLWEQIDEPALGVSVLFILASLWLTIKERNFGNLALAGLATAAYLAWVLPGMLFPNEPVYVDNATNQRLRVTLDGADWLTLEPTAYQRQTLRRGTYRVAVFDEKKTKELQSIAVTVGARDFGETDKIYILNMLGAGHYTVGQVTYGGDPGVLTPPRETADLWFSTEAFWVFDNAPPASLETKKGQTLTQGYVTRRGDHWAGTFQPPLAQ